ncbi:MAG: hypothetical protein JSV62_02325 [Promethearchaeota archaeon]|nr:MAG: hypothetical protein JSV62_02325 [Candidatus Lokiarchaeota archaeon]
MSSQTVGKKIHIFPVYYTFLEDSINFNQIVIPFTKFGKSKRLSYIYEGIEKINFKKSHPSFQKIFLDEFSD